MFSFRIDTLRQPGLVLVCLLSCVISARAQGGPGSQPELPVLGAQLTAGPIAFPSDIMVSVKTYGAVGDGVTDDTAAINRALSDGRSDTTADYYGRPKALYFPPGVYLVSNTLRWSGCCVTLQGDGVGATTIRLKPSSQGFNNSSAPKAVILTPDGIKSFHENIRDLSIFVSTGNPAAVGIDYDSNNSGAIEDVQITSDDGSTAGHAGIELARQYIGPLMVKDVSIRGFAIGYDINNGEYSATFERITLENQRVAGFRNVNQTISIRNLVSTSSAPVITNSGGTVMLLGAKLTGGSASNGAVQTDHASYFRNVASSGYGETLLDQTVAPSNLVKGFVREYVIGTPVSLFSEPIPGTLRLPIKETPSYADADLSKWAAFKPGGYGDNSSLQSVFDSGASTIYFPAGLVSSGYPDGAYFAWAATNIIVPDSVHRVVGFFSVINADPTGPGGGGVTLQVNSDSPDPLVIEQFGYGLQVNQTGSRPVVIKHAAVNYQSAPGAGSLFLEDVELATTRLYPGQHAWARQLNMESGGLKIQNQGGIFWILGLKTELGGTVIDTIDGGETEVLGGLIYPATPISPSDIAFTSTDSQVSYIYNEPVYCDSCGYAIEIQEGRSGAFQQITSSPDLFFTTPLFVGYTTSVSSAPVPSTPKAR